MNICQVCLNLGQGCPTSKQLGASSKGPYQWGCIPCRLHQGEPWPLQATSLQTPPNCFTSCPWHLPICPAPLSALSAHNPPPTAALCIWDLSHNSYTVHPWPPPLLLHAPICLSHHCTPYLQPSPHTAPHICNPLLYCAPQAHPQGPHAAALPCPLEYGQETGAGEGVGSHRLQLLL